jgi:hypothetical protein
MIRRVVVCLMASVALVVVTSGTVMANSGAGPAEPSYANGTTVWMIAPQKARVPNGDKVAQDLYLAVYPINPDGSTTLGPQTLPSGYQPQCNPCFHPGVPLPFSYHDHVLEGAPGFGTHGTVGAFNPIWHVYIVIYNPAFFLSNSFQPVKSAAALDAGEAAGEFLPINPGGANPYEVDTGIVFLCPLASQHA